MEIGLSQPIVEKSGYRRLPTLNVGCGLATQVVKVMTQKSPIEALSATEWTRLSIVPKEQFVT